MMDPVAKLDAATHVICPPDDVDPRVKPAQWDWFLSGPVYSPSTALLTMFFMISLVPP